MPSVRSVAIVALLALSTALSAQDQLDIDAYEIFDGRDLGLPPAADIDPAYLEEADFEYVFCSTRPKMAEQLDCGCRAMTFLSERLQDTEARQHIIRERVENECLDPVKMSAFHSKQCRNNRGLQRKYPAILSDLCNCMGREIAAGLIDRTRSGQFNGSTVRSVETRAQKQCLTRLN